MRAITLLLTFSAALPFSQAADPVVARLGSTELRHPEYPHSLAFAPSGTWFVSGGSDGSLRAWDAATGAKLRTLAVKDGIVTAVGFSGDGKLLAVHFADEKIRLLNADNFELIREIPSPNLGSISMTTNGALLLGVGLTGNLILVETANGLPRMELPEGKSAGLLPDGSAVLVADHAEKVTKYEIPSGKPLYSVGHLGEAGVSAIALSFDGKHFATVGSGKESRVRVWETATGMPVSDWASEGPIAFDSRNRIASRNAGTIRLRTLDGKADSEQEFPGDLFALHPDGSRIVTAVRGPRLRLWNTATGKEQSPRGDELGTLADLASDGQALVLATSTGIVRWVPGEKPRPVALATDSPQRLAVAGSHCFTPAGCSVEIRDSAGSSDATKAVFNPDGGIIRTLAVTPSGTRGVIATEAPNLLTFDVENRKSLHRWRVPSPALGVAISPDGHTVAMIGRDGFARCWNVEAAELKPMWTYRLARSFRAGIAFSPDGESVAVSSIIRVTVFDAKDGRKAAMYERGWEDGPFQTVAFSPDGRFVAAGSQGSAGGVTVWERATNTVAYRFAAGSGTVSSLAFLKRGRQLAALSADDSVTVWDVSSRHQSPVPTEAQLAAAWRTLDRVSATEGMNAAWVLVDGGAKSVERIRTGLNDAGATDRAIAKLITTLDSDVYQDREAATKELEQYSFRAIPALTTASRSHPSSEVRERAEYILGRIQKANGELPENGLYGEPLRQLRAVAVLEQIGTPEAIAVIRDIAKLTGPAARDAKQALKRLEESR